MSSANQCPFCASLNVWLGKFHEDLETTASITLDAIKPEFWRLLAGAGIYTHREVSACLSCGQFWGTFNLREAHDLVMEHGSERAKDRLNSFLPLEQQNG